MANKPNFTGMVELPEGVSATYENDMLTLTGPKGTTHKKLLHPRVNIKIKDGKIMFASPVKGVRALDKMYVNTFIAHANNLVKGVVHGYISTLKVCSGHFPMTVALQGKQVVIKNYFGEKVPRTCELMDNVKVNIQGDEITIEGINKEEVGQMAARIENTTSIKNRDRRIFQDGCYITKKAVIKDE